MQGHRRARTEVLGRLDEAGAEEGLPHAIHGDAGGEWRAAVGDPAGEGEAIRGGVGGERMQCGRDVGATG